MVEGLKRVRKADLGGGVVVRRGKSFVRLVGGMVALVTRIVRVDFGEGVVDYAFVGVDEDDRARQFMSGEIDGVEVA